MEKRKKILVAMAVIFVVAMVADVCFVVTCKSRCLTKIEATEKKYEDECKNKTMGTYTTDCFLLHESLLGVEYKKESCKNECDSVLSFFNNYIFLAFVVVELALVCMMVASKRKRAI